VGVRASPWPILLLARGVLEGEVNDAIFSISLFSHYNSFFNESQYLFL